MNSLAEVQETLQGIVEQLNTMAEAFELAKQFEADRSTAETTNGSASAAGMAGQAVTMVEVVAGLVEQSRAELEQLVQLVAAQQD